MPIALGQGDVERRERFLDTSRLGEHLGVVVDHIGIRGFLTPRPGIQLVGPVVLPGLGRVGRLLPQTPE